MPARLCPVARIQRGIAGVSRNSIAYYHFNSCYIPIPTCSGLRGSLVAITARPPAGENMGD